MSTSEKNTQRPDSENANQLPSNSSQSNTEESDTDDSFLDSETPAPEVASAMWTNSLNEYIEFINLYTS